MHRPSGLIAPMQECMKRETGDAARSMLRRYLKWGKPTDLPNATLAEARTRAAPGGLENSSGRL